MANLGAFVAPLDPNQGSRVFDISTEIDELTKFTPWVYDIAIARGEGADDVQFQWDEIDLTTDYVLVDNGAGYTAAATTITVDDGTLFTEKDKIRNLATDEVMQVTGISGNDLTVIRGVGESGVAITDDDPLLIIGPGMEQASVSPDENNANSTTVFNYLETFRKSFSFAGTLLRTNGTPGMDFVDTLERTTREILREIEYTLIFGKRDLNTTDFAKRRYTGQGLLKYISTNVESVGGTLTEAAWQEFLIEKAFRYGSQEKIMIAGPALFKALSFWTTANYQVNLVANVGIALGSSVSTYHAPTGQTLVILMHELLQTAADANLAGMGIIIDPEEIRLRWSANRSGTVPDQLLYKNGLLQVSQQNLATNDRDGLKTELFAELGLMLRNEQQHAVIEGVTGGA